MTLWTSLGVTSVFTILLLVWWGVLTEGGAQIKYNRSGPVGIVCITAVFIALLFLTYG